MRNENLSSGLSLLCQNDALVNDIIYPRFDEVVTQLAAYVEQIETYNPVWGLVGTNDRQELIVRHILDSLAPLGIIYRFLGDCGMVAGLASGNTSGNTDGNTNGNNNTNDNTGGNTSGNNNGYARVADVGSGAGLPGIPLAIVLPLVQFTLIERGGKRANFLRIVQKALGLANISVEEAEMEKVKPGQFNVVTFRAFRPLEPKIFKKLMRLCAPTGVLAAYKGRREKIIAEMTALEKALPDVAGRSEILHCPVPMLDEERHLVIIRSNA